MLYHNHDDCSNYYGAYVILCDNCVLIWLFREEDNSNGKQTGSFGTWLRDTAGLMEEEVDLKLLGT